MLARAVGRWVHAPSAELVGQRVLALVVHAVCLRTQPLVLPLDAWSSRRLAVCSDPSRCEEALRDVLYRSPCREAGWHREIEQPGYGHNQHGGGDTQRKG